MVSKSIKKNVREDGTEYAPTAFWSNPKTDGQGKQFLVTEFTINGQLYSFYGYPTKSGSIPWKVSTPRHNVVQDLASLVTAKS